MYRAPIQNISFHRRPGVRVRKVEYRIGHRIASAAVLGVFLVEALHLAEHYEHADMIGAAAVAGSWLRDLAHVFIERFTEDMPRL